MHIRLGDRVRDKVSGFVGIASGVSAYLNGCIRIHVQGPVDKNGKHVDGLLFDYQQIEVVERQVMAAPELPDFNEREEKAEPRQRTGGPQDPHKEL